MFGFLQLLDDLCANVSDGSFENYICALGVLRTMLATRLHTIQGLSELYKKEEDVV